MAEVSHAVFGRHDPDLVCECDHPRKYHNHMGLSENLIVGNNCNACRCQEFKEDKSVEATQRNIVKIREEIEARKKELQAQLTLADNELTQLQERCTHPNKCPRPEYDFTANQCGDCGLNWSTR